MTLIAAFTRGTQIHYEMSPATFLLFWFGFLGLMIVTLYAASRERRKRREGMARLGMETGFAFCEKPDSELANELASIQLSAQFGSTARFSNVLRGSRSGCDVAIADRTVGTGKNQSTSTMFAFKLSSPLPGFTLCHENVFWRVADKVGYTDIDFENAPEFSRRFFLHGADQAAIRAIFTPDVIQAFEQLSLEPNLHAASSGNWLAFYRPGRTVAVEQISATLQQTELIANAFRRAQAETVSSR